MGRACCIVSTLKEDEVSGLYVGRGHPRTELPQALRAQSAEVPANAAVVIDVTDEAGTVKGRGWTATAPDIRKSEIFLRLFDDGGKLIVLQCFRRNFVLLIFRVIIPAHIGGASKQVRAVAQGRHNRREASLPD